MGPVGSSTSDGPCGSAGCNKGAPGVMAVTRGSIGAEVGTAAQDSAANGVISGAGSSKGFRLVV